jgi:hypothetical protein
MLNKERAMLNKKRGGAHGAVFRYVTRRNGRRGTAGI